MTSVALRALAPAPDQTALLRACLPTGRPGREALERWADGLGDPVAALKEAPREITALLPVLLHAADANGAHLDRRLTKVMRAAWTHEELRGAVFEAACRDVLNELDEPAIVLPGVALVATVYGSWPLRHCHDLDLLVRARSGHTVHPSGMPVARHTGLASDALLDPVGDGPWRRAVTTDVAGVEARVLAPADALVHVCAHAAGRPAPSPRWALDAWWIVAPGNVDWPVVVDQSSGLLGPVLSALLDWLAAELEAPVPADVLAQLRRTASAADGVAVEFALSLARHRVGAAGLVRRAGRDRPVVVRSLLAPSRDYLRLRGVSRRAWIRGGAARLLRNR